MPGLTPAACRCCLGSFDDGLTRLCTEKYQEPHSRNLTNMCMHLTNYAVNKESDAFVQPDGLEDEGSHKRTVSSLLRTRSARQAKHGA